MDEVGAIKATVTMFDVCEKYGISVNRMGYALCPFHTEKTPSMRVYPGQRGWACFGCGKSGDVIDFVKDYFSLSFRDAVSKINNDFGLHILIDDNADYRTRLAAGRATYERKKRIAAEHKKLEDAENYYWEIYDDLLKIKDIKERHKPINPDDGIDPLFVQALLLQSQYEIELEIAEARRCRLYNERRQQ